MLVPHVFPIVLYQLVVLPLYKNRKKALDCLLASLLWGGHTHPVCRETVAQCPCHGGLGWLHLLCHWHTSRLVFLCCTWTEYSILEESVRDSFPSITIMLSVSKAERHCKPRNQSKLLQECRAALRALPWSSDLSRRLLYRDLVEEIVMDRLCGQLGIRVMLFLAVGTSGELPQQP